MGCDYSRSSIGRTSDLATVFLRGYARTDCTSARRPMLLLQNFFGTRSPPI